MSSVQELRSLRYVVTALEQFSVMLRDFEMTDTAKLLDVARRDLEAKLPKQEKQATHRV